MDITIKSEILRLGISQSFLVLPIFFLIYMSRVFNKVLETNHLVTFLFFIDDLRFIASSSLVKEMVKSLKEITYIVHE